MEGPTDPVRNNKFIRTCIFRHPYNPNANPNPNPNQPFG